MECGITNSAFLGALIQWQKISMDSRFSPHYVGEWGRPAIRQNNLGNEGEMKITVKSKDPVDFWGKVVKYARGRMQAKRQACVDIYVVTKT